MRVGQRPEVIDDLLWRCTLAAHAATPCCFKTAMNNHTNALMPHEKRSPTDNKWGYGFGFSVSGRYKVADKDTLTAQYTRVDGGIDMLCSLIGHAVNPIIGALTSDKEQGIVLGYARLFSEQLRSNLTPGFNGEQTVQAMDNRSPSQAFATVFKQCQI